MAVKLIDLQVLFGVAGARDAFERLVAKLIKAEHEQAETVRVKKGDDGIDVYVGEFKNPAGIDVFQCKYFFPSVGPTQQGQIRKSFKRVKNSTKFKTRTWTLCLPLDLAGDERAWFDAWKGKQAGTGITIADPWTALKLEALLCEEKNRGLKEEYFKQEHLTQIREMHGMLQNLVAGLAARLQEDAVSREQTRRLDAEERFGQYVEKFLSPLRDDFLTLVQERFGTLPYQTAQWETVIRPSWLHDLPWIKALGDCWSALQACRVGPVGMTYPEMSEVRRGSGLDWMGGTFASHCEVECYRFSQKCVFAHAVTIPEDQTAQPGATLYAGDAIIRLTQMFRFAKGLAEKVFDPNDGTVEMSIRLSGIRHRELTVPGVMPRMALQTSEPELTYRHGWKREELLADPDACAIRAAVWFFERFNWMSVDEPRLKRHQADFIRRI